MEKINQNGTDLQDSPRKVLPFVQQETPCCFRPTEESVERSVEPIATEAGHWYLPDGSPFYTVPRKSGPQKGQPRPVSLRWDRKLMMEKGAVPSVTTVTKIIEKPALVTYKTRQIFEATLAWCAGNERPISELDWDEVFKVVQKEADKHRDMAADRGTSLHTAIERFLQGKTVEERWKEHVDLVVATLNQYGITLGEGKTEHSFAHRLGFGGKVDYHEDEDFDQAALVLDFKSKDEVFEGGKPKKLAYDEHVMQIAAYREGLRIPKARGVNVFVGEHDKKVLIHEWNQSDLQRGWGLFELLLRFWKKSNNYYPKHEQTSQK